MSNRFLIKAFPACMQGEIFPINALRIDPANNVSILGKIL
ncbi:hypothetical protein BTN49_0325 (plasmid) [Candidatus Enterovibrio escicola]|uniref:Uncharacterized protein n=1 Tax=Candidatus Enterovibrio escicola TaxID=1927127 RepID=A0A2A5T6X3_9GAMM|nr:hypothetical protein BTN49_0325 [Candidatus Enterovibrio escacola]